MHELNASETRLVSGGNLQGMSEVVWLGCSAVALFALSYFFISGEIDYSKRLREHKSQVTDNDLQYREVLATLPEEQQRIIQRQLGYALFGEVNP